MNYNPSAPAISGLQWRVRTERAVSIAPGGPGLGIIADSTTTQVITGAAFNALSATSGGRFACDVYDITAGYPPVSTALSQLRIAPTWDSWNNSNTQSQYITPAGPSPNICEWPSPLNNGTGKSYVFLANEAQRNELITLRDFYNVPGIRIPGEVASSYKFNQATLAGLSGRRIEWVGAATNVANPSSWAFNVSLGIQPLVGSGTNISWRSIGLLGTSWWYNAQLFEAKWTVNPATRFQWTLNDVLNFAGTAPLNNTGFSIWVRGSGYGGWYLPQFFTLAMVVAHSPETRVATGTAFAGPTGWTTVPLTGPAGSGSFTKQAGRKYLFVFRSVVDPGGDIISSMPFFSTNVVSPHSPQVTVNTLDSGDVVPVGGSYDMPLSSAGVPSAAPTQYTRMPGLALMAGGAASVDSQVYNDLYARAVSTVGVSAQQNLRYTGSSLTFGGVRATIGWAGGTEPTQVLRVRIVNRGTGVVYATGSISAAEVRNGDLRSGQLSDVRISLTDSTPTAPPINTQLFIEFFTTTAGDTWQVYGLSDRGVHSAQGYGGLTDTEVYAGAPNGERDLLVTMAQRPSAPTLAVPTIV